MPAPRLPVVWILRAAWLVLPFTLGPLLGAAADDRSRPVQLVSATGAWAGWAVVLVALLVPSTVSLTGLRTVAAALPAATALALHLQDGRASAAVAGLGVAASLATAALAFAPGVGQAFAQGSAYGDEARFPLRAPAPLLAGPLQVAWALTVVPPTAGALALAARQWVLGAALLALGLPLAVVLARRLHRLSRRWLVFVPVGVVLHDHLGLTDSLLVRRADLAGLRAAPADSTAVDATARATGLALELRLRQPAPLTLAGDLSHRSGRPEVATAVLFTPTRPGAVLAEAARRGLPTG